MSIPSKVAARISHPSKTVVRITPDNGYDLAIFAADSGKIEAIITDKVGDESWRVYLVDAKPDETIVIRKIGDSTEVLYVAR